MQSIAGTITTPTLDEQTESRYLAFRRAADRLVEAIGAGGRLPAGADLTVLLSGPPAAGPEGGLTHLARVWARLTAKSTGSVAEHYWSITVGVFEAVRFLKDSAPLDELYNELARIAGRNPLTGEVAA